MPHPRCGYSAVCVLLRWHFLSSYAWLLDRLYPSGLPGNGSGRFDRDPNNHSITQTHEGTMKILFIALLFAVSAQAQTKPCIAHDSFGRTHGCPTADSSLIRPRIKAIERADGNFDISAKCPKRVDVHVDQEALKAFNANPNRDTRDALYLLTHHATCVKTPAKKSKP